MRAECWNVNYSHQVSHQTATSNRTTTARTVISDADFIDSPIEEAGFQPPDGECRVTMVPPCVVSRSWFRSLRANLGASEFDYSKVTRVQCLDSRASWLFLLPPPVSSVADCRIRSRTMQLGLEQLYHRDSTEVRSSRFPSRSLVGYALG